MHEDVEEERSLENAIYQIAGTLNKIHNKLEQLAMGNVGPAGPKGEQGLTGMQGGPGKDAPIEERLPGDKTIAEVGPDKPAGQYSK